MLIRPRSQAELGNLIAGQAQLGIHGGVPKCNLGTRRKLIKNNIFMIAFISKPKFSNNFLTNLLSSISLSSFNIP
jgi:hypothetical protein